MAVSIEIASSSNDRNLMAENTDLLKDIGSIFLNFFPVK